MTSPVPDRDRTLSAATARLLRAAGGSAGALGLGNAAVAATALLLATRPGAGTVAAWAVLALLPAERLLALRVGFDAGLFADLARAPHGTQQALGALDGALHTLRLRGPAATVRPLADRVRGAQRLLLMQAGVVGLQAAAASVLLATRAAA